MCELKVAVMGFIGKRTSTCFFISFLNDFRLTLHYPLQLRPTFADAFSNLANAYTRKGNLIKASTCCHQALALNPRLVIDSYFC